MISCTIKNFGVAINCQATTSVHLTKTVIMNADIGIECNDPSVSITFEETKIENSKQFGIVYQCVDPNDDNKRSVFSTVEDCRARYVGNQSFNGDG